MSIIFLHAKVSYSVQLQAWGPSFRWRCSNYFWVWFFWAWLCPPLPVKEQSLTLLSLPLILLCNVTLHICFYNYFCTSRSYLESSSFNCFWNRITFNSKDFFFPNTHTHMHQINILSPWNDNSHLFLGDTPLLEDFSSFGQRGMRRGRISLPGTGISLQTNPTQILQPRQILLLAFILPGWFY